jgi:hypothetical protein
MEGLLAGLLIAQASLSPHVLAQNPAVIYRLGSTVGMFMCHYMPYGRTKEVTAYMAAEYYTANVENEAPGLLKYVSDLPEGNKTKQVFYNGMGDVMYSQCPGYFSLPER